MVSTAQRMVPHVAALALQALKASHTCLLIFKVENVMPSRSKVKWSAETRMLETHIPETCNIPKHNHHVCMYVCSDPHANVLSKKLLSSLPPSFLTLPTPPSLHLPPPHLLPSIPVYTHTCKTIQNKDYYLVYQRRSDTITLQFICM